MKTIKQLLEGKKDFEPHMMYDPKTGKGYKAEKPEDHERMKKMGYSHDKPEVKEAKSSSGYELYHRDFSGAMQHAYAHAKKKGFIVDKDDVDHKVAMGPKRPSSGKTNKYILDTNKKQKLHVQVANLDNKRYELNMYIESVEDFDLDFFLENARAKRDAMSAMGKRGKDSADIDTDATDDDRKAASKNVLMQIRKLSDLPKGGEIEFENGKKGKISQDDASKVVKMFNTLKKPQDKAKFQKVISKDLKTIQSLVKRLGR